jgi:phosphatidylglycerophosphate synthase
LAFPIYFTGAAGHWKLGFWLLAIALITDFLDGLAAKKLHAQSVLGGHIDRVSDWLLSAAGSLGLIVGAHILSLWLLVVALPLSAFVGYIKIFTPEGTKIYRITAVFSVSLLFITWSCIVWGYLWQAFGWSWAYPILTLISLIIAARLKKHRLKAWFGWIVASRSKKKR